jgi:prepilin-type N-terminal cleavage/methylation domain-containing protein/prepilin-type processing-associated H-X9-DG protein
MRHKQGFTLVEVLVTIAIIAVMMAILLPTLSVARESSRTVQCIANLRQLGLAAQFYTTQFRGSFPIAYDGTASWDFRITTDPATGAPKPVPGILWWSTSPMKIQQCPSFDGRSNTPHDPYTGYNYNVSFIGHGVGEAIQAPARLSQVKRPSQTALFGDGAWRNGANKYMRAPFPNPGDATFIGRFAGTQGFRHRKSTNVCFVDGHVESLRDRFTNSTSFDMPQIAPGTGFLSPDNSLYDLD